MKTASEPTTRVCCTCKVEKPLEDYHRSKKHPLGRGYQCKVCVRARHSRKWHDEQKHDVERRERMRAYHQEYNRAAQLRKYGLTQEEYDWLLFLQDGQCAICKKTPEQSGLTGRNGQRLHVDHCHDTGVVRGLLCTRCNTLLGMAGDSPECLRAAIYYLGGER